MSEEVHEITKRGDWYTVKGVVDGRKVSMDVPAPTMEGQGRDKAMKGLKAGLRLVDDASRERQ